MGISAGSRVQVINALGERSERIAVTGAVAGRDFVVVWVCRPEEFERAQSEGVEPDAFPYPAEDVRIAVTA